MEQFEGTRGPWQMETDFTNSILIVDSDHVEVCGIIAVNEDDLLTEKELGNARLIAAAPDLLAALEQLVHLHLCEQEGISSGQPSPIQWLTAVDHASDAINKALGREV